MALVPFELEAQNSSGSGPTLCLLRQQAARQTAVVSGCWLNEWCFHHLRVIKRDGKYSAAAGGGGKHVGPLPVLTLLKVKAPHTSRRRPPSLCGSHCESESAASCSEHGFRSLLTTFRALLSNQKIMGPFLEHLQCVPIRADCREDGCLWWSWGCPERRGAWRASHLAVLYIRVAVI